MTANLEGGEREGSEDDIAGRCTDRVFEGGDLGAQNGEEDCKPCEEDAQR